MNTAEIQAGYKQKKTQCKMTEGGKMQLLYTGGEMKVVDGKMTPEKTKQQEMSKDRGEIPKRNMHKTDKYWTLDDYRAVRMLNNEERNPRTRKGVIRIQTQEEAERILGNVKHIRYLVDTEPEKAKCAICKQKNIDKYMKTSKDNRKWCEECRQRSQQHD